LGFIGGLRSWQNLWVAVEPAFEHIGEEHAAQSRIERYVERRKRFVHGDRLERLPAAQEFAVDLADLL
jgi:hypothetical protein